MMRRSRYIALAYARNSIACLLLLLMACKQPVKDCCSGKPHAGMDTMPQHWLNVGFANNKIPEEGNVYIEDVPSINNIQRPDKSYVVAPALDTALLFGVWASGAAAPVADFEWDANGFMVGDYDGNGDMPFVLKQDTLAVFYNDFVRTGIITAVSKDSLQLRWIDPERDLAWSYLRWKQ